jgi:hypothetical protein
MREKSLITILILLYLIDKPSYALPNIDQTVRLSTFENYSPYVLQDDQDENIFYLPFTRLALASLESEPKRPDFSFVYLPEGLIIQLSVEVAIDQNGLRPLITNIKAKNPAARFRYLPVTTGRFMPTLRNEIGLDTYAKSQTDFKIAHNHPREKRALTFFFTRTVADLIVLSIAKGGGFAINYEYQFKAAVTPSTAQIKINWQAVEQFLASHITIGTPLSPTGIHQLVRQMATHRAISIKLIGNNRHLGAILKRVSAFIRESCFQSVSFRGLKSVSAGLTLRQKGCDNKVVEFVYQSTGIEELTALAGFQLPSLCFEYPDHFRFMDKKGQLVKGCPDGIYGATGKGPQVLTHKPTPQRTEIPKPIINANPVFP